MAEFVCTRTSAHTPTVSTSTPWTPAHHASTHKTKPVRLLELGTGHHGKTALLEFPEGWQRTIDLPTQADAWHPLFDDLPQAERSRLRTHADHPVVRRPDGTRTQQGALSFVTKEIGRNGDWTGDRYFDVPAEDYSTGGITGYRCAGELLAALQRGYGPYLHLNNILEEVMAAADEPSGKASRRGAGVTFLEVVNESLTFMAKHARHTEFVAGRIVQAEKYQAHCIEQDAKKKAEFVERMRQARAKKRAAKEVTA